MRLITNACGDGVRARQQRLSGPAAAEATGDVRIWLPLRSGRAEG
jgi:hypothetical protein